MKPAEKLRRILDALPHLRSSNGPMYTALHGIPNVPENQLTWKEVAELVEPRGAINISPTKSTKDTMDKTKPASDDQTSEKALAVLVDRACMDFEDLRDMIERQIQLSWSESKDPATSIRRKRAPSDIQMALAKSFVTNIVRARRIVEGGAASLKLDRSERTRFLKATEKMVPVRDVNEHGYDPDAYSKPAMHFQEGGLLDETSLVTLGPDKILMGPVNLAEIFPAVNCLRNLVGFSALSKRDTADSPPKSS
jgi:hypothetical protein